MKQYIERLWNGLVKENPVLVLMLGMCPALAVTTQAANGIGMGLSTLAVLVLSNLIISYLRSIYIPLIVVNCIILGRAEAYANKHTPMLSVMDGIGMGLGFTVALTLAGAIRELLGAGTVFGLRLLPESFSMTIFIQPPGAFLVFALIIAVMNAIGIRTRQRQLVESGCDGNCALCNTACDSRTTEKAEPAAEQKGGDKA